MTRGELIHVIEQAQMAIYNYLDNRQHTDQEAVFVREMRAVLEKDIHPAISWWENGDESSEG